MKPVREIVDVQKLDDKERKKRGSRTKKNNLVNNRTTTDDSGLLPRDSMLPTRQQ